MTQFCVRWWCFLQSQITQVIKAKTSSHSGHLCLKNRTEATVNSENNRRPRSFSPPAPGRRPIGSPAWARWGTFIFKGNSTHSSGSACQCSPTQSRLPVSNVDQDFDLISACCYNPVYLRESHIYPAIVPLSCTLTVALYWRLVRLRNTPLR